MTEHLANGYDLARVEPSMVDHVWQDTAHPAVARLAVRPEVESSEVAGAAGREDDQQGHRPDTHSQRVYRRSPSTEAYLRSTYGKLGVSSRTKAALWALRNGWGSQS